MRFYDELIRLAPTLGACVSRAAAIAELRGPAAGLAALDEIPPDAVTAYQPYWAVRAHLLAGSNQADAARQAYTRAIGLSEDEAVRRFLMRREQALA